MTAATSRTSPLPVYSESECPSPKEPVKAGETPAFVDARRRAAIAREQSDLLHQCRTEIIALPHQKFVDIWITRFDQKLRDMAAKDGARTIAETLCKERISYEKRFSVVVCTTVGSPKKLPEFSVHARIPTGAERFPDGIVYLSKEAREQYAAMKKSPLNTKEFRELATALENSTDLFPKTYTRGSCLASAMIKTDLLALCGMPRENMQHCYVCLPTELRNGIYGRVDFHCSVRAKLADINYTTLLDSETAPFQGIENRQWDWVKVWWKFPTKMKDED